MCVTVQKLTRLKSVAFCELSSGWKLEPKYEWVVRSVSNVLLLMDHFFLFLELKSTPGVYCFGVHTRLHTHSHAHTHARTPPHTHNSSCASVSWVGLSTWAPSPAHTWKVEAEGSQVPGYPELGITRRQSDFNSEVKLLATDKFLFVPLYISRVFFFLHGIQNIILCEFSSLLLKQFIFICMGVTFAHECCVCRVQKRAPDLLELDLQAAVSCLIDMDAGTILLTTKF